MHMYNNNNNAKVGNTVPVIFKLSRASTALRVTTHVLAILVNGREVGIIVGNYRETFPSSCVCQKRVLLRLIPMLSPLMNARIVYTDSIHLFIHACSPLRFNVAESRRRGKRSRRIVCSSRNGNNSCVSR